MSKTGKITNNRKPKTGKRTYAKRHFNRNALTEEPLSKLYDRFMLEKRTQGLARITLQGYDIHYGYFISYIEDKYDMKDLAYHEIVSSIFVEYIQYLTGERGLKAISANVRIRTLRAFLRWCYDEEYIDEPIHKKFKPLKVPEKQVEALTADEVRQVFSVIDKDTFVGFRDYVMLAIILDTLPRVTELCSITKENVRLENKEILLEAEDTKGKKYRVLPISNHTRKLLDEYLLEVADFYEDYLFVTYDGRPLNEGTFRKNLSEYGKLSGVKGKRISPHTFRHTGALMYIMNGGDPFSLQKLLGHRDISMTRIYVNMLDDRVKMQHDKYSPLKSLLK